MNEKNFSHEELQNLLVLINRAQIQGAEAISVVTLQQKIQSMLNLQKETINKLEINSLENKKK